MKNILISVITLVTISALTFSCAEEEIGPVIDLSGASFVSAELTNATSAGPIELLPDNADSEFEKFEWSKSEYGVDIPVNYVLEIDSASSFPKPSALTTTATTEFSITVTKFNDAVLNLGLPAFAESTVYIRVKSLVVGAKMDTLISGTITRAVTPYRLSDCGNFCTMGLIGDATLGGWSDDIDMRLADATGADRSTWTITTYLTAAHAKFRAQDNWDDNWGGAAFPSGTGEAGGADIAINAAGWYTITFNDQTLAYSFELLAAPTYTSIGVIGPAQAGGWDSDTDLTQDPMNPHMWSGSITFTAGEAKIRADNDWAANWGGTGYPSGVGKRDGDNIVVEAGTFTVYFNDVTQEYAFQSDGTKFTTIGFIGPAQDGGWDSDTDLIKNPNNPYLWSGVLFLNDGEGKFRAENDWADNWGASTYPSGLGIKNGPNIPVTAGKYVVLFNSGTGEYRLLK